MFNINKHITITLIFLAFLFFTQLHGSHRQDGIVMVMGPRATGKSTFIASMNDKASFSYDAKRYELLMDVKQENNNQDDIDNNLPAVKKKNDFSDNLTTKQYKIYENKGLFLCDTRGFYNTAAVDKTKYSSENKQTINEYTYLFKNKTIKGIVLIFSPSDFTGRNDSAFSNYLEALVALFKSVNAISNNRALIDDDHYSYNGKKLKKRKCFARCSTSNKKYTMEKNKYC